MKEDAMDAVFRALAHPDRRRILDVLKEQPGCNVNELWGYFEHSRIALLKHLGVLEEAGLLQSEKVGRERKLYFNSVPIQMIYDRWTTDFSRLWSSQLTRVKYRVESKTRRKK